jgi:hypothetical protein
MNLVMVASFVNIILRGLQLQLDYVCFKYYVSSELIEIRSPVALSMTDH